jgi:DNA-directed RNA polymerase subunit RPC12/RpoP
MDYSATIPYSDGREQTCSNCGAEFSVIITKQTAHNEREEYNCPECGEEYYARASMPIRKIIAMKLCSKNSQIFFREGDFGFVSYKIARICARAK